MGYACANCGVDFPTRREIIEHMAEKHNCTYLEGDFKDLSEKLLSKKTDDKSAKLKEQHAYARGD